MPLNLSLILTAIFQKFEQKGALGASRVGHIFQLKFSILIFYLFIFIHVKQTWYRKLIHIPCYYKQVCLVLEYLQFWLKIINSPRFKNSVPHVTLFKNSSYRKSEKYESLIFPYLLSLISKVFRCILNFYEFPSGFLQFFVRNNILEMLRNFVPHVTRLFHL